MFSLKVVVFAFEIIVYDKSQITFCMSNWLKASIKSPVEAALLYCSVLFACFAEKK